MTDAEKVLIEINGRLGAIEANVKDIRHSLYGNGQPGMTTRLAALEHSHKSCRDQHEKEEEKQEKHYGTIAAVIAFIVNAIIAVYAAMK